MKVAGARTTSVAPQRDHLQRSLDRLHITVSSDLAVTRSRRRTTHQHVPTPRHRFLTILAAGGQLGADDHPHSVTDAGNELEQWDILDAPGLAPPLDQRPRTDFLSKVGRALHAALAAAIPLFASAELIRRLTVTLSMVALLRVGHYLPVPDLDVAALLPKGYPAGSIPSDMAIGVVNSLTSALTGSRELSGNIYLLSITPFMTASFTLAVLHVVPEVRRHLARLRDEGRPGREVINGYINSLFVVSAISQAFVESGKLVPLAAAAAVSGFIPIRFQLGSALTLLAGAVVCKWAVQTVDQWGLGDGIGVVIGAGIALCELEKDVYLIFRPYWFC